MFDELLQTINKHTKIRPDFPFLGRERQFRLKEGRVGEGEERGREVEEERDGRDDGKNGGRSEGEMGMEGKAGIVVEEGKGKGKERARGEALDEAEGGTEGDELDAVLRDLANGELSDEEGPVHRACFLHPSSLLSSTSVSSSPSGYIHWAVLTYASSLSLSFYLHLAAVLIERERPRRGRERSGRIAREQGQLGVHAQVPRRCGRGLQVSKR
jgi:hypothetical protein